MGFWCGVPTERKPGVFTLILFSNPLFSSVCRSAAVLANHAVAHGALEPQLVVIRTLLVGRGSSAPTNDMVLLEVSSDLDSFLMKSKSPAQPQCLLHVLPDLNFEDTGCARAALNFVLDHARRWLKVLSRSLTGSWCCPRRWCLNGLRRRRLLRLLYLSLSPRLRLLRLLHQWPEINVTKHPAQQASSFCGLFRIWREEFPQLGCECRCIQILIERFS